MTISEFKKGRLPNSIPKDIDPDVVAKLAVNPQCHRLGHECKKLCETLDEQHQYPVELDHIIARSAGGSNDIDNLQWLCRCENRKKYNKPDVRYGAPLYFDKELNLDQLRPHQQSLAYGKILKEYREHFERPAEILNVFLLLGWLVGAGKTVGMLSILFAINHVRKNIANGSAKRIKRVLWLVNQNALVDSLADELEHEFAKYNILEHKPSVVKVTDRAKWGYRADITVACPQAIWDSNNNSLSESERAEILSSFDAIVIDEAHFAIDRYLDIIQLAPQAFKFAVTATPMNRDGNLFCDMDGGNYKHYFALFSKFGYGAGRDIGIYKELLPFSEGFNKTYFAEDGGSAVIKEGGQTYTEEKTKVENNLPRQIGIINSVRNRAIKASQSSAYDHHVMVRCKDITHVKSLAKNIERFNDATAVYSGCSGSSLGDKKHPWMLAKSNNGKIPEKGRRFVLTVDIGQYGINNKYCSIIVWLDANQSFIEIIQRIGRAIRGTDDNAQVQLVWDSKDEKFAERLEQAIDFILNMEERLDAFPCVGETDGSIIPIETSPVVAALKPADRVKIADIMGSLINYVQHENLVSHTVDAFLESNHSERPISVGELNKIEQYAEMLTTSEGRATAFHIPQIFEPSRLCLEEEPPKSYGVDRIINALASGEIQPLLIKDHRDLKIQRINDGDELSIAECQTELREMDEKARKLDEICFYDPALIVQGKTKDKLPFLSYTQILTHKYAPMFRNDYRVATTHIKKVLYTVVAKHFGLPDFRKDTYQAFDKQLSDALMRETERRHILAKAEYELIRRDIPELAHLRTLFADQYLVSGSEGSNHE